MLTQSLDALNWPNCPSAGPSWPPSWRTGVRVSALYLVGWLFVAICQAQDAAVADPPKSPAATTTVQPNTAKGDVVSQIPNTGSRIQYVGPDTYILLDSQGRPQAMPGMTYEDFMAAWKESQQAAPRERRPRFTVERVLISGQAGDEHAKLRLEVAVKLLGDGQVDVPLGLVGAILQGEPQFGRDPHDVPTENSQDAENTRGNSVDAPAVEYVDYDPQQGGIVAHLTGEAGEQRTVVLELLVPLVRDGVETTLALNCPRALAAQMTLDVDTPVSQASITSGALLSREPITGGTRFAATGFVGQFRLTWNTAELETVEQTTVLSATGAVNVSIDGRSVRTDARLTVRSYGGSFDRFRVRLPQGATLIPERFSGGDEEPNYRITMEDATKPANGRTGVANGPIVLVQFKEELQGPVTVDFATEQLLGSPDADLAMELGGFEVLGAVRQFGDVALRVADDWQLRWDSGRYVRQVDASELGVALQQPGVSAAFQYDRQPWSLGIRVAARRFRIQVTPDYELECLADETRLRVHLTYQILGARAFEFQIDLAGWELTADPVESGGLVDRDQIRLTREGQLILPLTQASSRRAEVSFFVRRAVPRDAKRLSLPLPVPVAESIATGDLVVRVAPGIELMPDALQVGLTATPVTATQNDSNSDDTEFRFRCFLPEAVFEAERLTRAREVSANIAAHVEIEESRAFVTQRVEYAVRFEPISELVFEVPRELLLENGDSEVLLLPTSHGWHVGDERPETILQLVTAEDEETPANGSARSARVALPQPRLGRFAVEFRYSVRRPNARTAGDSWQVPLARPLDGQVTETQATVRTPRETVATLDRAIETTWTSVAATPQEADPIEGNKFVANGQEVSLPLVIRSVDLNAPTTTIIERTWLQTWLSGNTRQERAAFRFRTAARLVTIELPPETAAHEVEVLLDGSLADVASRDAGRIVVRLDPELGGGDQETGDLATSKPRTLELRYRRIAYDRLVTRRRLTPPQWVGMAALSEVYWQIVLPGDLHVVQSPNQLAAASQWQWLGSFWGRRPTSTQADLEEWVGATPQIAPSTAQNEYLFSGMSPVSSIEVVTAPRWLIVLMGSGGVLAFALAWLYLPIVRRGWVVGMVACLLAGLAAVYPTPAMLLAQASVLGVVLAGLALFIARLGKRPQQWSLPLPGGSSHRQLTPRAESAMISPLATAGASTAPTAQLHAPDSER